ncbi:MAG: BON domain-containing protein [Gemmatimonadaceae bacterium]|nr:BON domain-containing protein [Gemmatimonadaceae bacterium]
MAQDFENVFDLDDLSDEELRGLVRTQLAEYDTLDVDGMLVNVKDGYVTLSGRVGTEPEKQVADHVLSDVIGLESFSNDLFVDPVRRDEAPEAADEQVAAADSRGEGSLLGGVDTETTDPEAARIDDNDDASLFGTRDMQRTMENGLPWIPPDEPTPEGRDAP